MGFQTSEVLMNGFLISETNWVIFIILEVIILFLNPIKHLHLMTQHFEEVQKSESTLGSRIYL